VVAVLEEEEEEEEVEVEEEEVEVEEEVEEEEEEVVEEEEVEEVEVEEEVEEEVGGKRGGGYHRVRVLREVSGVSLEGLSSHRRSLHVRERLAVEGQWIVTIYRIRIHCIIMIPNSGVLER